MENWLRPYNKRRPREALDNLTPVECPLKNLEVSTVDWH